MSNGYYIEQNGKPWKSSYNKQVRPDPQSRMKNVIPASKMVEKRGRYFSTDTSVQKRTNEIENSMKNEMVPKLGPKKKFLGKNC